MEVRLLWLDLPGLLEIGRGAADYLINAISGLSVPKNIQLPYRIIMRGSTAPAPPSLARKSPRASAVRNR